METIELFATTRNTDQTEGRGANVPTGYFRDRRIAEAVVMDKRYAQFCIMGVQTNSDIKDMIDSKPINIYDSVEDFFNNLDGKVRERAIAKLSMEERRVLGLL